MNMNFKKISFIVGFILLSIWLISANFFIGNFFVPKENRITKSDLNYWLSKENREVTVLLNKGYETGKFFDTFILYGGAFCEREEGTSGNKARTIHVILSSDSNTYVSEAINVIRVDVFTKFKDSKKMYNGEVGFQAEFSTIAMKDGIYDLYIYVKENDDIYGINNTGLKYIRDKNGFRELE